MTSDRNLACPGLLVSVRNAAEAHTAMAGGADVIDVKEPSRGPLGAADASVAAEVFRAIAGRRLVTAAGSDLGDRSPTELANWVREAGIQMVKLGVPNTPTEHVFAAMRDLRRAKPTRVTVTPVIYADRVSPDFVGLPALQSLASASRSNWLVVDTYDKSRGSLLASWRLADLELLIRDAHECGMRVVLAGSLSLDSLPRLGPLRPDLIGVRGAVCEGGRLGSLSQELVERARASIDAHGPTKNLTPPEESPYSVG